MGHRHRATHRDRDLTTQPATARPGNLDVEEPAQAGRTPMPTSTLPPRPTEITAHESTAVDQGSTMSDPEDSVAGADIRAVRVTQPDQGTTNGKTTFRVRIDKISLDTTVRWVLGDTVKFTAWRTRSGKSRLRAQHLSDGEPRFRCPQARAWWDTQSVTLRYDRRCDASAGAADPPMLDARALTVRVFTFLPGSFEYLDAARAPRLNAWTTPARE